MEWFCDFVAENEIWKFIIEYIYIVYKKIALGLYKIWIAEKKQFKSYAENIIKFSVARLLNTPQENILIA